MNYVEVEQARALPGLRLVLTEGVPGPWGEAAKNVFHVKKIPYTAVRQAGGEANDALRAWTGFDNAPQAVWQDERARTGFAEIVLLAERLQPEPRLLPAPPRERALAFGLLHELAGEMGFAWCRRLQLLHPILAQLGDAAPEAVKRLAGKYGYASEPEPMARADARVVEVLGLFSQLLREQEERGVPFLVGDGLSAVDLYWAAFAAMLEPLPAEQCPMPEYLRAGYTLSEPRARAAADPILFAHRDRIYRDHLVLPLDF